MNEGFAFQMSFNLFQIIHKNGFLCETQEKQRC